MIHTFICTIFLLIITIISYRRYKDFFAAPFVLSFIYLFDFLFFIIANFVDKTNYWLNTYSYYFVIGQFIFLFGYDILFHHDLHFINQNEKHLYEKSYQKYHFTLIYKLFILLQFLILILYFIHMLYFTREIYNYNLINIIIAGKTKKYVDPYVFRLFRTISFAFSFVSTYFFFSKNISKNDKLYVYIQLIISFLFLMLNFSRQWIFILIIPLIFITLQCSNIRKKSRLIVTTFFVLIFITIIQTILVNRNFDLDFIRLYLNSGIVSFTEWVARPFQKLYGQYTFRFIFAILKKIGLYHGDVQYMPMEYINVPGINWKHGLGNVYTFYYGFVNDFGLVYGLAIQFILGIFHGTLYKQYMKYKDGFFTCVCAVFYMPLVVHFFMEHYVSHISLWLQIILIIVLATKTNIFYESEKN